MLSKLFTKVERRVRGNPLAKYFATYSIPSTEAHALASSAGGDLEAVFYSGRGRRVHKWTHYLPIYERHFGAYRGSSFRMLEIGVFGGGSLDMWRDYFGPDATLFGVDVNPDCAGLADPPTQIRIGSQDDPQFLRSVVEEMGGIDIVLDDGSHVGRHQIVSFDTLFPLLNDGGLYVIEDLHTSYWWYQHQGGYRRRGTAIEFIKQIVDDMHGWYHSRPPRTSAKHWIGALHIYDSMVVIEKRKREKPGHIIIEQSQARAKP